MKIEDIVYELPEEIVSKDDFDLEKWREENPMDYLKAIFVLNQATDSDVKNEIF